MKPELFLDGRIQLFHGDSRKVLKGLADNSVDSVCTDPPYALVSIVKRFAKSPRNEKTENTENPFGRTGRGFMGQTWDNGSTAFDPKFWREVIRVLKPGGYVLAASGTRTYHRLACAVEDAGFEIRDMIQWLYSSGFPKSHDPAWMLHKQAAAACGAMVEVADGEPLPQHELRFVRAAYLSTPIYACAECGKVLQPFVPEQDPQSHRQAWAKSTACWPEQPVLEGRGDMEKDSRELSGCSLCPMPIRVFADGADGRVCHGASLGDGSVPWQVPDEDGSRSSYRPQSVEQCARQLDALRLECVAQEVRGRGTALKPACEPWVLARKPLIGTLAENICQFGTGALNINGCRIDSEKPTGWAGANTWNESNMGLGKDGDARPVNGRWPANLIHDGSSEVVSLFPDAPGQQRAVTGMERSHRTLHAYGNFGATCDGFEPRGDEGSAARFFYSAKADANDRLGSGHPTVKPVDLMQYFCRLVTPPGGVVLDLFAGTGTTGEAVWREGFKAILIERDEKYCEDIRKRLRLVLSGPATRRAAAMSEKPKRPAPLFGE